MWPDFHGGIVARIHATKRELSHYQQHMQLLYICAHQCVCVCVWWGVGVRGEEEGVAQDIKSTRNLFCLDS